MEIDLSSYKDSEIYVGNVDGRNIKILKTYKVIKGNVDFSSTGGTTFKDFTVEVVTGDFSCLDCTNLKTLQGAPRVVGKSFDCKYCYFETLRGAPREVGGSFNCCECNNLKSLEYSPLKVGGYFACANCKNLESLEGAPREVGYDFDCIGCKKINILKSAEVLKYCEIKGIINPNSLKICVDYLKTPNEFIRLNNINVKLKLKKEE